MEPVGWCVYVWPASISPYSWHSSNLQLSRNFLAGSNSTWGADMCWGQLCWVNEEKERTVSCTDLHVFVSTFVQPHVMLHLNAGPECLVFVYIMVCAPPWVRTRSWGSNNNWVPQTDELQPCSSLSPPSVTLFSHIPLSVAGVTAGPDAAPGQSGFVLQMALSSLSLFTSPPVCLLCASVMCSCTPVLISIAMLIWAVE